MMGVGVSDTFEIVELFCSPMLYVCEWQMLDHDTCSALALLLPVY